MNTVYRIGAHYVRANSIREASRIAHSAADGEPLSIQMSWLSNSPVKCASFVNQTFGNSEYDRVVNDETHGMIERFARKAIQANKRKGYSLNERRLIETAAANIIQNLFGS